MQSRMPPPAAGFGGETRAGRRRGEAERPARGTTLSASSGALVRRTQASRAAWSSCERRPVGSGEARRCCRGGGGRDAVHEDLEVVAFFADALIEVEEAEAMAGTGATSEVETKAMIRVMASSPTRATVP